MARRWEPRAKVWLSQIAQDTPADRISASKDGAAIAASSQFGAESGTTIEVKCSESLGAAMLASRFIILQTFPVFAKSRLTSAPPFLQLVGILAIFSGTGGCIAPSSQAAEFQSALPHSPAQATGAAAASNDFTDAKASSMLAKARALPLADLGAAHPPATPAVARAIDVAMGTSQ
jgi:hypothetical protein